MVSVTEMHFFSIGIEKRAGLVALELDEFGKCQIIVTINCNSYCRNFWC